MANAIFDATGVRLRRVPFRNERVLTALRAAGVKKPPVLEFWLTMNPWVQLTRVVERCHRAAGEAVGRAECLEIICP